MATMAELPIATTRTVGEMVHSAGDGLTWDQVFASFRVPASEMGREARRRAEKRARKLARKAGK